MKLFNLGMICFFLVVSSLLSGCNSLNWQKEPVLAVPEQVTYPEELKIAQISQQLSKQNLDQETYIQLLFERGMNYSSLGLRTFAQSDFSYILSYNPTIPDIYNQFGIYALEEGDFDSALLALNTALELDVNYAFAYLNRAIVLYRSARYESAYKDIDKFYQYDTNQPIAIIWAYLIEHEIDKQAARNVLQRRYEQMNDRTVWGSDIIAFYLGQITEPRLMQNLQKGITSNRKLAERLCETYFYLGKYYQSKGDNKRAETLFKYALANNIYNFVEHQQALYELRLQQDK